jgi:hypothetical protein
MNFDTSYYREHILKLVIILNVLIYINVYVNGVPYKLTILHHMYQLF